MMINEENKEIILTDDYTLYNPFQQQQLIEKEEELIVPECTPLLTCKKHDMIYIQEYLDRVIQLPVQESLEPFQLLHCRLKAFIFSFILFSKEEEEIKFNKKEYFNLSLVCREFYQLLKDLKNNNYLMFDYFNYTILGNKFDGFKILNLNEIPKVFITFGNVENRRIGYWNTALQTFGISIYKNISYEKLLTSGVINTNNHQMMVVDNDQIAMIDWEYLIANIKLKFENKYKRKLIPEKDIIIRFDSPGENWFVERGILSLGYNHILNERFGMRINEYEINNTLVFDLGRVRYMRQWYLGFLNLMNQICLELNRFNICNFINHPKDIRVTFDKRLCHSLLSSYNIPVPLAFYNIRNYDDLIKRMNEYNLNRVFIKPAHGSSASGVIAYCFMGKDNYFKELATTSAELVRDRFYPQFFRIYNSLRIKRYTKNEDIKDVINFICDEGVIVEEWLEKANYLGRGNFDLRIIVVAGKMMNFVVRTSRNPMTNLHLGNKRGDCDDFLRLIHKKAPGSWERIQETCWKLYHLCFPNCVCLGVDMMLTPDFNEHYVIEVNGFGDLIPRVYYDNLDTYQVQVRELLERSLLEDNQQLEEDNHVETDAMLDNETVD
ncbi:hypothetical protein ABK040_009420 [Willaertia magna]